jgi:hypothetical protein
MAPFAPNTAQVFCHMGSKRFLVRQNLVADPAGCVAQVDVIVIVAVCSRAVRFVAHTAKETAANFVNLPRQSGRPSLDGLGERIACKFQVAC